MTASTQRRPELGNSNSRARETESKRGARVESNYFPQPAKFRRRRGKTVARGNRMYHYDATLALVICIFRLRGISLAAKLPSDKGERAISGRRRSRISFAKVIRYKNLLDASSYVHVQAARIVFGFVYRDSRAESRPTVGICKRMRG